MENDILKRISKFIVEKRAFIFLLFAGLIVFCILSMGMRKMCLSIADL